VQDIGEKESGAPRELTPLGDRLFFVAHSPSRGEEIWVLSGNGVNNCRDIVPGPEGSSPSGLTAWRGQVYFRAYDSEHGVELWVTNGTTNGTRLLRDIVSLPVMNSRVPAAVPFGGGLFFAHEDGVRGHELWRLSEEGSRGQIVKDIARVHSPR
jgi:ELWxxDGT repeat protein